MKTKLIQRTLLRFPKLIAAILCMVATILSSAALNAEEEKGELIYLNDGVKVIRRKVALNGYYKYDRVKGDFIYRAELVPASFLANHCFEITVQYEIQKWSFERTENETEFPDGVDGGYYLKRLELRWRSDKEKLLVTPSNRYDLSNSLGYGTNIRNIRVMIVDRGTKEPAEFTIEKTVPADVFGDYEVGPR